MENVTATILFGRFFCGIFLQKKIFKHSLVGMSLRRFFGKDFRFKDCLVRIFLDEFTVFCDVVSFWFFFGYLSLDCFFTKFLAAVSIEICLVDVFLVAWTSTRSCWRLFGAQLICWHAAALRHRFCYFFSQFLVRHGVPSLKFLVQAASATPVALFSGFRTFWRPDFDSWIFCSLVASFLRPFAR